MVLSNLVKIGLAIFAVGSPFILIYAKEQSSSQPRSASSEMGHSHSPSTLSPGQKKLEETGDPYTLSTCPVSGQKLGEMGEPVIYSYKGREVRLCCSECIDKLEKVPLKYLNAVDQALTKEQLPVYPLNTCLVSGEKLGEMGDVVNKVYNNRLVRFCCPACVTKFEQDPKKFLSQLNQAVIKKQIPGYPLNVCIVSGDKLGGSMGEIKDIVIGNRLVRLCCPPCEKELRKEPSKYISQLNRTPKQEKNQTPAVPHNHNH